MARYSSHTRAQLTCEACKQRKVKCDKRHPCTTCRKAGIHCVGVVRARLPRGRSAKKVKRLQQETPSQFQTTLSDRVSMLEDRIQSFLDSCAESSSLLDDRRFVPASIGGDSSLNSPVTENYQGKVLNAPVIETGDTLNVLSTRLLQIYLEQVDPVLPILQPSTLWALTSETGPYLSYAEDHPAPRALACAISYMAITTLTNEQCYKELNTPRSVLLDTHHNLTQLALTEANYIDTNDLTVLQAFVLFLISIPAHGQSRRAWTLLSLALRIAQSLFLDRPDPPVVVSPIESQLRQRLWHVISLLDVQVSFDRGSAPILQADCLQPQVLLTTDLLGSPQLPEEHVLLGPGPTSLTDPTFIILMAEAQHAFRCLDVSGTRSQTMIDSDMHDRLRIAAAFQQETTRILSKSEPLNSSVHWFFEQIASVTHAFLHLVAVHPVQTSFNGPFSQDIVSQSMSLPLAVTFLQRMNDMHRDPCIEPFRWYTRLFPPWHAFSVAMDQVRACSDASVREYYRSVVNSLYSSLQDLIGDSYRSSLQWPLQQFTLLPETYVSQDTVPDSPPEARLLNS